MTEQEINDKYKHYATVGALLDFIEKHNIPRDSKILLQRVHDHYFERKDSGWDAIERTCQIEGVNQYTPCWSPRGYEDDKILYLDAHY